MLKKIIKKILTKSGLSICPNVFASEGFSNKNKNIGAFKFWTRMAQKDKYLGKFYAPRNSGLKENLDLLVNDGLIIVDNFLEKPVHAQLVGLINQAEREKKDGVKYGQGVLAKYIVLKNEMISNSFNKLLSPLTNEIFGNPFSCEELALQILECKSNDVGDPNTVLHIDRYIPAVKMFYYPFGISPGCSPYGYIPKSSLIDDSYKKACVDAFRSDSNLLPPFKMPQWFLETLPVERQIFARENTLVVGATNGLHRRCPIEQLGKRYSIRILFYNSEITKFRLLKNYLKF